MLHCRRKELSVKNPGSNYKKNWYSLSVPTFRRVFEAAVYYCSKELGLKKEVPKA